MSIKYFFVLLLGVTLLLTGCGGSEETATKSGELPTAIPLPLFITRASPQVQVAYHYAVEHPEALDDVPCYCGCGGMGHTSNLSCFITDASMAAGKIEFADHGSACGVCVGIALDVKRLTEEGQSPREIRAYIDATYSSYGPGTNTPLPS
jgi:hypothetical protein